MAEKKVANKVKKQKSNDAAHSPKVNPVAKEEVAKKVTKVEKSTSSKAESNSAKPSVHKEIDHSVKPITKKETIKSNKKNKKPINKKASPKNYDGPSVTLKQIVSSSGSLKSQIQTLKGLGLNKVNKISTLNDTQSIRGMIKKVAHLIKIINK